jgi:hypothetical protein
MSESTSDRRTTTRTTVRIEQPTANKVTMVTVIAGASYILFILLSKIDGSPFLVMFLVALAALWIFGYRTLRIDATADSSGIDVHNLMKTDRCRWAAIDNVTVEPNKSGGGVGIVIHRTDGEKTAIESSWGPWYQGTKGIAQANEQRCRDLVASINEVRPAGIDGDT